LRDEAKRVVADPDLWLATPHEFLGGRSPSEMFEEGNDQAVRDLLRAIKYGMMT
jgi:hypothetical protein